MFAIDMNGADGAPGFTRSAHEGAPRRKTTCLLAVAGVSVVVLAFVANRYNRFLGLPKNISQYGASIEEVKMAEGEPDHDPTVAPK